jgi:hypothetical protein
MYLDGIDKEACSKFSAVIFHHGATIPAQGSASSPMAPDSGHALGKPLHNKVAAKGERTKS